MPKPLHGWRAFVGEVGIIVIGVLIALAAEQAVETVHWRHEVAEQRQSMTAEVRDGIEMVSLHRAQQPCIDRRLAAIREVLRRHAAGQPLGIVGGFAYPTRANASQGSWDIALAGQALSHMPEDERLTFSGTFGSLKLWNALTEQERAIWTRLSLLTAPDELNETDWSNVRLAYAEAADMNAQRAAFADFIVQRAAQDRFSFTPATLKGSDVFSRLDREICEPYVR